MDRGDDLSNGTHFWREGSSDYNNIENVDDLSDISSETSPCRGFEKQPKVVIERFNIQPFLNKPTPKLRECRSKSLNSKHKVLSQYTSSCFVKLVRDNLNKLKKEVEENSRLNQIKAIKTDGILMTPFLQCKICEKAYSSERKLQNHQENKHMVVYKTGCSNMPQKRVSFSDHVVVHELQEYHRCRKCTKIFEEYKSLKSHMKQEHKKRKCYICHYCSKNFVDRMFFKIHIKLHCDICGDFLLNRHRYLMHRRDTCRVLKKYNCKTCQIMFFSYMDLKDHSYDHLEDLFICDICKDQHTTKCAVSHHIQFLHSKKRPKELYTNRNLGNERLYLCNFCDVCSIERDVIDKHVSILPDLNNRKRTGYKDYYFCDQCLRKFNTETKMLQHKWSHFLNNSDNFMVKSNKKIKTKSKTSKQSKPIQRVFKINEKLPNFIQPKVILERIDFVDIKNNMKHAKTVLDETTEENVDLTKMQGLENLKPYEEVNVVVKKAIVDPKSKKTLISRFQCEKCHKYYSSNYCLNRHIMTQHKDYANLRCNVCEESFVWPSLLKTHKCIRMNIPEMPFDDARPEIQLNNYYEFGHAGFDELMNISESENYLHSVDFEIPAPIVQLTEYEDCVINQNHNSVHMNSDYGISLHNNSYKIVFQEVPIEF